MLAVDGLSPVCPNTSIIKYADDILFLHFLRSSAEDQLQMEWHNLSNWSRSLHLSVNESKCVVMDIITKANLVTSDIHTSAHELLRKVEHFTFLGVTFSNNMKWNLHVSHIVKKASKRIFIIRSLRRCGCPVKLMMMSYFAFIRSVLTYACACFCNIPEYLVRELIRVERRVFRIIGIECPRVSLISAMDDACEKLFSSISVSDDHPLRDLFTKINSCTRRSSQLCAPMARTQRFKQSFIRFCK